VIERDHLPSQTRLVSAVKTYPDYPGEMHPMKRFAVWLGEMGYEGKKIGVEGRASYSSPWGYKGVDLKELMHTTEFVHVGDEIHEMRIIKSEAEISLVKESVKWGAVAHRYLQQMTEQGRYDWEVAAEASLRASEEMKKELGSEYKATHWGLLPAVADFRGQVGAHSAYPHSISTEREMRRGDILGTGASADVGGYHSELERNIFLGPPDEKVSRLHDKMLKMQDAALNAMKPGRSCSEADRASYGVAKQEGLTDFIRHHTGHGMGLEGHEAPFLDIGDTSPLRPGMVLSVEPGLYVPGLGGFRHSDTVVVREGDVELLTDYPRRASELTV
jgi:Xaa-Pro dipeptidase